ncbi:MAG: dicarboxylate/amino acid:cation symporter [Gammaproteobacteria bacterium]|nr:dicarboxylate/amino acid:cation symporter [Gammaproteobacteria bacterium]MCW5583748.1 dicarboxylate/amino acid:cation symporter [Gammaproteobacteria bacterium]
MKKLLLKPINLYLAAVILGLLSGIYENNGLYQVAEFFSNLFIRLFRCLGTPIIAVSLITTLSSFSHAEISTTGRKTLVYTIATTIIAALTSMALYLLIQPLSSSMPASSAAGYTSQDGSYLKHITNIVPTNFLSPFIDNQVITILFLGIAIGFAIRCIPNKDAQQTVMQFFRGLQSILFVLTKWVVAILPIGIYGFVCVSVVQYQHGFNIQSLGQYFAVILLANFIQGFLVLPVWLKCKGIKPFDSMKKMMPALSVAFFSKSSSGTLPLTIETAEKRLGLNASVTRFVLPLCTTINMNGCAAFIFTTVIYVMQSNGVAISIGTMIAWVLIATIAALGNAGVPMGCFFLSATLLTNMNVPIELLGLILPIYSVIDMVETSLNVWSDSCVANVVNKDLLSSLDTDITRYPVPQEMS